MFQQYFLYKRIIKYILKIYMIYLFYLKLSQQYYWFSIIIFKFNKFYNLNLKMIKE